MEPCGKGKKILGRCEEIVVSHNVIWNIENKCHSSMENALEVSNEPGYKEHNPKLYEKQRLYICI